MYQIKMERYLCIAYGNCIDICPKFWEMADERLLALKGFKKSKGDGRKRSGSRECILDASRKFVQ